MTTPTPASESEGRRAIIKAEGDGLFTIYDAATDELLGLPNMPDDEDDTEQGANS